MSIDRNAIILASAALAKANRENEDLVAENNQLQDKLQSVYSAIGATFIGDSVEQIQLIDRVDELELDKHNHTNKSVLDSITQEMLDEIQTLRQEVDILKTHH